MELNAFKKEFEDSILIESLKKSFDILKTIIASDSDYRNNVLSQNQRYEQNEKHYRDGKIEQDRYAVTINRIFEGLVDIVEQLSEDDLEEKWFELDIINANFQQELELEEELMKDMAILDLAEEATKTIILTDTKGINKEDVVVLETLVLNCQDALGVDKYEDALAYCEEARKIDIKSPQLYEYLAYIHFKKKPPEELIEEALNGTGENFLQVIQYTRRYHQFKDRFKSNFATLGDDNISNIGRVLAQSIRDKYKKLKKGDRNLVWKCILCYKQVFDVMLSPLTFLETVILELSGGGVIEWLKLSNDKVVNRRRDFDALGLREEFMQRLADYYKEKKIGLGEEETFELAANRAGNFHFQHINRKYNRIRQEKNAQGKYRWNDEHWKEVVHYIKSSKVAYFLYEEERFLHGPFNELCHQGKRFMPWFDISPGGKLRTFYLAQKSQIDALAELRFFAEKLQKIPDKVKEEMKTKLFVEKEERAMKKYHYATEKFRNIPNPDLRRIREDIIYALDSWLILYRNQDNDLIDQYLEKAIAELSGKGLLQDWLLVNADGEIESGPDCKTIKFKSKKIFKAFLHSRSEEDLDVPIPEINISFFEDLFQKAFDAYNRVVVYSPLDDEWEDERYKIIECLQNLELCFLANPSAKYLQPIINELYHNGKLLWLAVEEGKEVNLPICYSLKFDAIAFRDLCVERMKKINPHYKAPVQSKSNDIRTIFRNIFSRKVPTSI